MFNKVLTYLLTYLLHHLGLLRTLLGPASGHIFSFFIRSNFFTHIGFVDRIQFKCGG